MKKLITFGTICIVTCIVFSSCSSSFEITKRHYNKGYYINHSSNKESALITKERASEVKIATPVYPVTASIEQNTKIANSVPIYKTENTVIGTNARKTEHRTILASNVGQMAKNMPTATEAPATRIKSSVLGISSVTDDGNHNRRDALSLFWLIILIVLIVWLIGLVTGGFGMGGFINILLVIALILLILWLLRVV